MNIEPVGNSALDDGPPLRSYCLARVVGSEIVVARGTKTASSTSTVEKFNSISDTWSGVALLGNPHR